MIEKFYTHDFDEEFKSIEIEMDSDKIYFYKIHEELMPFVGTDYKNSDIKVLFVGESHYVDNNWHMNEKNWRSYDIGKWVKPDWQEIFKPFSYDKEGNQLETKDENFTSWFNTRMHANRVGNPTASEKALKNLIKRPLGVLNQTFGFTFGIKNIAFFNFFQYPSLCNGQTIRNSINNKTWEELFAFSLELVARAVEIIKPDIIILLSADLYDKKDAIKSRISEISDPGVAICATYHAGDNRVWYHKYKKLNDKKPGDYLADELQKALQGLKK